MASNTFDGLMTEMTQALAVIEPQIRGLDDLTHVSLSNETLGAIRTADDNRKRRRGYLTQVIAALEALQRALDNLTTDGYPAVPKSDVTAEIFAELEGQRADEAAALAQFQQEAAPVADVLTIDLGQPANKPAP